MFDYEAYKRSRPLLGYKNVRVLEVKKNQLRRDLGYRKADIQGYIQKVRKDDNGKSSILNVIHVNRRLGPKMKNKIVNHELLHYKVQHDKSLRGHSKEIRRIVKTNPDIFSFYKGKKERPNLHEEVKVRVIESMRKYPSSQKDMREDYPNLFDKLKKYLRK